MTKCYFCNGSGILTDDSECPCAIGICSCQYCNRSNGNPDKWCDTCHGLGVETSRIDDIHTATTTCITCKGVGKLPK